MVLLEQWKKGTSQHDQVTVQMFPIKENIFFLVRAMRVFANLDSYVTLA